MIFVVEGFDVGRGGNSLVAGVQDWGANWGGGTFGGDIEFTTGLDSVGAITNLGGLGGVHNGFWSRSDGSGLWAAGISRQHRIGFVLSTPVVSPEELPEEAWSHVFVIDNNDDMILLEVAGDNRVRLCYTHPSMWSQPVFDSFDFVPDDEKIILTTPTEVDLSNLLGVQLEIFINWDTSFVELRSEGMFLVSSPPGVFPVAPGSSVLGGIYAHRVNDVGWKAVVFDHLYATTGESLQEGINAVWHAATLDTFANGYKPMLQFDGTRYYGPGLATFVPLTSFPGAVNYIYWPWYTNPAGGGWSTQAFEAIENWGFCYANIFDVPDIARGYTMHLMTLEVTDGRPRVRMYWPDELTTFSGPWVKSNPARPYIDHIYTLPRRLTSDNLFLEIAEDGCTFWPEMAPEPRPFQDVGLSFAEEFDVTYHDWRSITNGEDFSSYFISGYKVHGEGNKAFQSNYVTFQYQSRDNSSAFVQGVWDYALQGNTGRWGSTQQIMRRQAPSDYYKHQQAKLKIRGHGTALQFRVVSQTARPFLLNGWTVYVTGNQI